MTVADSHAPKNVRRARSEGASEPAATTKPARSGGNRRTIEPAQPPPAPRMGAVRRALSRLRGVRVRGRVDWGHVRTVLTYAGKLTVVALVLVAAGAAGRLIERYVRSSPAFAIREIRIEGATRLARDEIQRTGGVSLGSNVFAMPPEDVRARLQRHPWVADASVRRRLPGTVEIEIRERRAAAVLVVDRAYLVGEDATVFKSLDIGEPTDLPVVTLASPERWLGDRAAFGTLLLDVVSLLHEFRRVGLESRGAIQEVHIGNDDGVSLYLGDEAMEVRLGRAPFDQKLRRLRLLLDEVRRRDSEPAYVLLDHERRPDRAVVRLRETLVPLPPMDREDPVPPEPRAPTPSRRRPARSSRGA